MTQYEKLNFVNGSPPALNAATLNYMEDGIAAATEGVTAVEKTVKDNKTETNTALATKADKTEVDTKLSGKADKAILAELGTQVFESYPYEWMYAIKDIRITDGSTIAIKNVKRTSTRNAIILYLVENGALSTVKLYANVDSDITGYATYSNPAKTVTMTVNWDEIPYDTVVDFASNYVLCSAWCYGNTRLEYLLNKAKEEAINYAKLNKLDNTAGSVKTDNIASKAITMEKLDEDVTNQFSKLKCDLVAKTDIKKISDLANDEIVDYVINPFNKRKYDGKSAKIKLIKDKTYYIIAESSDAIPGDVGWISITYLLGGIKDKIWTGYSESQYNTYVNLYGGIGVINSYTPSEDCYMFIPLEYNGKNVEGVFHIYDSYEFGNRYYDILGIQSVDSEERIAWINKLINSSRSGLNYKGTINPYILPHITAENNMQYGDCYRYDGKNRLYEVYENIINDGDYIFWNGTTWEGIKVDFEQKHIPQKQMYDVCIIGGGAGGIGSAYALKDSGLKVCLIEQLDTLGGTHCNAGVINLLPSPVPDFFKTICKDMFDKGLASWKTNSHVIGSDDETQFDKLWRGSYINYGKSGSSWGNHFNINPFWFSHKYYEDLSKSIDIMLNTKVIDKCDIDGNISWVKLKNKSGNETTIYARYFIDATAENNVARMGKELGVDYFIGSDAKSKYNEYAINSDASGDIYEINSLEPSYMVQTVSKDITGGWEESDINVRNDTSVISGVNNSWNIPYTYKYAGTWYKHGNVTYGYYSSGLTVISPDLYAGITPQDYIDKGYDYAYNKGRNNSLLHWIKYKKNGNINRRYFFQMPLLAIREGYRMNCERMLTQNDIETLATSSNITSEKYIALSSWWVDIHNPKTIDKNRITFNPLFGIPYECIVPTSYKNVLIASRGFGASHIASSASRLAKTVMSIGYSAGWAMRYACENKLDDLRNVDVSYIQTNANVTDLLEDIENHFTFN